MTKQRVAVIIGAGPAGLTAAWEFLDRTDILPVVLEATGEIGGLSRTVCHRGNRMDLGGHRFFSKSDKVMEWWLNILLRQGAGARDDLLLGREVQVATAVSTRGIGNTAGLRRPGPDPEREDEVMLVRSRLSRILFLRQFFDYPMSLSAATLRKLGPARTMRIAMSYFAARMAPIRDPASLEEFFINQFGRELYATFFRDYTEKVWGVSCREIPPEWGAQRIKGLSLTRAVWHALTKAFRQGDVTRQKGTETSLIESFLYPKFGPGQLWERVAADIEAAGGDIRRGRRVTGIEFEGKRAVAVLAEGPGGEERIAADVVLSSMPMRALVAGLQTDVPEEARRVAEGLVYRDFRTVGVLASRLSLRNETRQRTVNDIVPDNWIYVQEPDVKVGRLQVFNNWSPYLVADPETVWLGCEYFCTEGDDLWALDDAAMSALAVSELEAIGVLSARDVLDTTGVRVPKAYPAYFGTYKDFATLRTCLDDFENLYLMGRNGMHRYNNMDHSMLTAMLAVDKAERGDADKEGLWRVNAEEEYHESK